MTVRRGWREAREHRDGGRGLGQADPPRQAVPAPIPSLTLRGWLRASVALEPMSRGEYQWMTLCSRLAMIVPNAAQAMIVASVTTMTKVSR